jgi:hypothetical protein
MALIVLLLTRRLPPLFFTAAVALLLFPLTILGGLSLQMMSPNISPFADTLHSCIRTSWKTVVPLLVGFDILQLGAKRFSINLREIHSRWDFLRIERNIPLGRRVLRGAILGFAVTIYLSLIAVGAINYAGVYQLLCFSLPPAPLLPKGQANAFTIMQERFMKKTSPELPEPAVLGHSALKGGKWGYLLTPEEKEKFNAYWNANQPYFDDFRRAAEAGVYQHRPRNIHFIKARVPNFVNIRRAADAIATRAEILIGEGRIKEAIETAAQLVRFGAMLQTDGTLVQRMIGVAVKAIGFNTFQAVYQWDKGSEAAKLLSESVGGLLRDSEADMDSLFAALHNLLPYVRKDTWRLETDFLEDEPGLKWPARVSIVAGIAVPGMLKAKNTICLKTMQFDTLYLGVACRAYQARHGRYPSDPRELIPEILPLWPRDPWSRRPYVLEVNGDQLIIRTVQPPSEKDVPGVRLEYPETPSAKPAGETGAMENTGTLDQRSRNQTRICPPLPPTRFPGEIISTLSFCPPFHHAPPRHCAPLMSLRAERSNPPYPAIRDCFAPLAMTQGSKKIASSLRSSQ